MKTYKFPFFVAYADTDAGGIVYHGRYIEIAERARMNMLRALNFQSKDIGFVVCNLSIKYMTPLKLGDDFVVESHIIKLGASFMQIQQKFVKNDKIYAIMDVKVVCLGKNMRPTKIPDDVRRQFSD